MWKRRNNYYERTIMPKPDFHNAVYERIYDDGFTDLLKNEKSICGLYILSGTITIYDEKIEPDTLLWITGGDSLRVFMQSEVHAVCMETSLPLEKDCSWNIIHESDVPWSRPLTSAMTASRHMIKAEEYGIKVQTCIYTNGFTHVSHTHTNAHLIYVLEGMLEQKSGADDRLYGPGEYALALPQEEVLHTLAPHASFCRYLFIGDGLFDFIVDGKNIYKH